MKTLFISLLSILFIINNSAIGQTDSFEPTIIILLPNNISTDNALKNEIDSMSLDIRNSKYLKNQVVNLKEALQGDIESNIKIMYKKQLEFIQSPQYDIYYNISSFLEKYIQYNFFETFNKLLVFSIPTKLSDKNTSFKNIADSYKVQHIVNIEDISLSLKNNKKVSSVTLQLFDNSSKKIIFNKTSSGDSKNQGFYFACSDGSIDCTIKNALSKTINELMMIIYNNNSTIQEEQNLAQKRELTLEVLYNLNPEQSIPRIIYNSDSNIVTDGFYQGWMNKSKDKFVAFFLQTYSQVQANKKNNEDDIGSKLLSSLGYISENTLEAFIVVGVRQEGKWHVEETHMTSFEAESAEDGKFEYFNILQRLDYFKDSSTELNSDFWNTNLFSEINR